MCRINWHIRKFRKTNQKLVNQKKTLNHRSKQKEKRDMNSAQMKA